MSDEIRGEVKQILAPDEVDDYVVPSAVRDIDDDVYLVVIDEGDESKLDRARRWIPFTAPSNVHDIVLDEVWFAEGDTVTIDTEPLRTTDTHDTLEARSDEAHYRTTADLQRDDSSAAQYGWGLGIWSVSVLIVGTLTASTHLGDGAGAAVFVAGVVALALLDDHVDDVAEWLTQTLEGGETDEDDEDPFDEAREAFLRGEIDEDEFEARLDDEIGEEHEHDREERVMER
ncbi:hypothetical protein [Haloarcula rubripromontorii]|uniref:hypothetical protein n=1 Tax=Haloarcula rubripromontorii TaxID=1705562 RepID=UPI00345B6DAB